MQKPLVPIISMSSDLSYLRLHLKTNPHIKELVKPTS